MPCDEVSGVRCQVSGGMILVVIGRISDGGSKYNLIDGHVLTHCTATPVAHGRTLILILYSR
jgi:hypothetical protein